MKKLQYLLLITFGMMSMLWTSCENFLEIPPPGAAAPENMVSESGCNALLVGTYNRLLFISRKTAGDMSDDIGNAGSSTAFGTFNGNGSVAGSWSSIYDAVQRSNDVLRTLAKVVENNLISTENALQIEAEARFLRAVYHLEAALWWRNVPYLDETNTFSDGTYFVTNTEPIWPKIEADFQFAADNLTASKKEVGRANSWAAKAFLAKTYIFQEKWSAAKTLLEDIIANGQTSNGLKYALNEKFWNNFNTSGKHGPECVFTVQNAVWVGARMGNPSYYQQGTYYGPAFNCCGWGMVSEDLVDAFQVDATTGLPLLNGAYKNTKVKRDWGVKSETPWDPHDGPLDPRLDYTVGRRGIPYLDWGVHPGRNWHRWPTVTCYSFMKNTPSQAGGNTDNDNSPTGGVSNAYNMIRFADVLLWAAECEVEIGSLAQAEMYVNQIRARAANPVGWVYKYLDDSNPMGGYSTTPAANYQIGLYTGQFAANGQAYAREAVHFERRLELACEYHRWFDLQRYDAMDPGYMGNTMNTYLAGRLNMHPNAVITYTPGWEFRIGINEIGMIPLSEIELMESMAGFPVLTQNPGYETE